MSAVHLSTISHQGRFWDVYMELEERRVGDDRARGRLVFSPADQQQAEAPVRTAVIVVEDTAEAALERARELTLHQLVGLLRSCLP